MSHTKKQTQQTGYLPTLDGWRAVAITGVILAHDDVHRIGSITTGWFHPNGSLGVDIFFAISGILICSRLLEEEHLQGALSLKHFYLRRAFRILPAAALYLIIVALLSAFGKIVASHGECAASLLFLRNYPSAWAHYSPPSWFTGHFWSLAVEEHFYLLLPALIVFIPKRARLWTLICLALIIVVHRFIALEHRSAELLQFHSDIRMDELFLPAALAVFLRNYGNRWRAYHFLRVWPSFAVLSVVTITLVSNYGAQKTILSILLPLMVAGSVLHSQNLLGKLLELPAIRFVGKLSYSLYLWQQMFFTLSQYGQTPLGLLQRFPWNYIATLVCALTSFYFVENPLIRLGHRVAAPATIGR